MKLLAWHSTERLFDAPSLDAKPHRRSQDNGALGFWVTFNRVHRHLYGYHLYEMYLDAAIPQTRFFERDEFEKICAVIKNGRAGYREWRQDLLGRGFKIALVLDAKGQFDMAAVLDLSVIQWFHITVVYGSQRFPG